jgi:hypothetical protein
MFAANRMQVAARKTTFWPMVLQMAAAASLMIS